MSSDQKKNKEQTQFDDSDLTKKISENIDKILSSDCVLSEKMDYSDFKEKTPEGKSIRKR